MKKFLQHIMRIATLGVLACTGITALLCDAESLTALLASKAAAAACLLFCWRLLSRWSKSDKAIAAWLKCADL